MADTVPDDQHALTNKLTQLETEFHSFSRQTTRTLETVANSITESNRRAEENERVFRDSLDRLASEWFNRLSTADQATATKFEQRKPNLFAIAGLIAAIVLPSAGLVGYSVKSGIAPIAERQDLLLRGHYQLEQTVHDMEMERVSDMDDRQDADIKYLSKELDRVRDQMTWKD